MSSDAEEKHETSTQVKKVRKSLSPEEVFKFKEEHSEMTNDEIAKHFNVSSRTIRKKIQQYRENFKYFNNLSIDLFSCKKN